MASRKVEVVYRATDSLIPYVNNARTHSDAQVAEIAGSIREFGFTNPVLIDPDGGIIAGHGRVLAARKLQLTEVPCIVLSGLTETQRRAYVLADNRIALNAGWNAELLALELEALTEVKFDPTTIGFGQAEVDNILGAFKEPEGEPDPNPWEGMPEFGTKPRSFRRLVVHFDDADAVADFARRLGQEVPDKAKSIWHPYKDKNDFTQQSWEDEEGEGEPDDVVDADDAALAEAAG